MSTDELHDCDLSAENQRADDRTDPDLAQPTYFIEKQEVVDIVQFMCDHLPKKHDVVIENPVTTGITTNTSSNTKTSAQPHDSRLDRSQESFSEILSKIARFEKVVGQYQELSQLLKPHLEDLAVPLIHLFSERLPQTQEQLSSIREKPIQSYFDNNEKSKQSPDQNERQHHSPARGFQHNDAQHNNRSDDEDGATATGIRSATDQGSLDDDDASVDGRIVVPESYQHHNNHNQRQHHQHQNGHDGNGSRAENENGDDETAASASAAALNVDTRLGQDFEEYELDAERTSWHQAARLVCFICKVVGFKSVIGFFPHDVKMLEPCFRALLAWMRHPQARPEWEVRYCLLLWLSNLILVPFALNNIDSSASVGSLSSALLETALTFLGDSSKCREGAALFVGRLLTRPDAEGHRARLMQEAIVEMNVLATTGLSSHVRAGGILHAAAITFKTGCREELVGFARMLIPVVAPVTLKSGDARVCKTATKLLQRLGLALLPNRPQPWRYNKARTAFLGQQSLGGCSKEEVEKEKTTTTTKKTTKEHKQEEQQQTEATAAAVRDQNEEKEKEVNRAHEHGNDETDETLSLVHLQQVEEVVDVLLAALGHQDTMVRYSAAKGLGRICERLPRDCADDIVSAITDLDNGPFAVRENDSNWHGATLALAEICRRYALLPSRFSQLVPIVEKALTYDVCKGSYSVGSHVRDAASYICWAAARSYNVEDLVDYVTPLARALVTTALTDREVNVRRAASAAFQECAGRLGNFPHAIDIITTVDFYALANLRHALLDVAPKIAWIEEYRTALFDRLLNDRIKHWSKDVREISAAALGLLCNSMVEYAGDAAEKQKMEQHLVNTVIPDLCKKVVDPAAAVTDRHGFVCALAEIVGRWKIPTTASTKAIMNNNNENNNNNNNTNNADDDRIGTLLIELIPHLEAKRWFRGRGAEYLRQACCKLVENVSLANLAVKDKISRPGLREVEQVSMRAVMQAFFEETCKNPLRWLQRAGADAMKAFGETFYPTFNAKFHGALVGRLIDGYGKSAKELEEEMKKPKDQKTPNDRRGICLMLGALPASVLLTPSALSPRHVIFFDVLNELCQASSSSSSSSSFLCQQQQKNQQPSSPSSLSSAVDGEQQAGEISNSNSNTKTNKLAIGSTRAAEGEDAECREEAVRALGRCCVTVLRKEASQDTATTTPSVFAQHYTSLIEPAFLNATEDYATDRRGDVGLFVRLAAIESYRDVLEKLISLSSKTKSNANHTPSQQQQPQQQQLMAIDALTRFHLLRFVNVCLKQAMEKVDRVRTVATKQLHSFIENVFVRDCESERSDDRDRDQTCHQLRPSIVETLLLSAGASSSDTMPTDFKKLVQVFHALPAEHDFAAPSAAFDLIVPNLIALPSFTEHIVDGLGASAGCLTPHVAQSALDSMVKATTTTHVDNDGRRILKSAIAKALISRLAVYRVSERMCVSCLLMTERCLEKSIIDDRDILSEAIDFAHDAFKTFAKDIQRTLALIPIMSSFARRSSIAVVARAARVKSWQALLLLLGTRFPKVRALASVELFTVLAALTDDALSAASLSPSAVSDAQQRLTSTKWDSVGGASAELKDVRQNLFELLKLGVPSIDEFKGFEAAGAGIGYVKKQVSELAMYKTLVAEKGY